MQCSKCGISFNPPARTRKGGKPRTRCDRCRGNIAKIDGVRWRAVRLQVLTEEPWCTWPGCGRRSQEADHIIPLAVVLRTGGDPYARSNLQGMCKRHNSGKGARIGPPKPRNLRRWVL